MSLLDDNLIEEMDNTIIENYIREWLEKYTYSRETILNDCEEIQLIPKIIIHDNIIDLEYPKPLKLVIGYNVKYIPIKYFKFGKINCPISLGENFQKCPGAIESLEGLPTEVSGYYDASWCTNLKSLKGLPEIIHGNLYLKGTDFKIKEHIYLPKVIEGDLYINMDDQEEINIICKNHTIEGEIIGNYNKFNNLGKLIKSTRL